MKKININGMNLNKIELKIILFISLLPLFITFIIRFIFNIKLIITY